MNGPVDRLKKQTYNPRLERTGFFCSVCRGEVRNENGLVYFESPETVQSLTVCHNCLPDDLE